MALMSNVPRRRMGTSGTGSEKRTAMREVGCGVERDAGGVSREMCIRDSPQTVRRVIPTMTSEFSLLYKDTSMLAAVGVMEVVMYAKTIVASTGSITPYIVAACFYLVITLPLAKLVSMLEAKLAGSDSGASGLSLIHILSSSRCRF